MTSPLLQLMIDSALEAGASLNQRNRVMRTPGGPILAQIAAKRLFAPRHL